MRTRRLSNPSVQTPSERGLSMVPRYYSIVLMLALAAAGVEAAKLIDSGPITNKIFMLRFRDGEYQHSGLNMATTAWEDKLDTAKAKLADTWSISSSDDADFSGGVKPTEVGRKSKGTDFKGYGSPNHYSDHFIFLVLPTALKQGKNYTLSSSGIIGDQSFTYDEFSMRNEAIHASHFGYSPQSTTKYAYLSMMMGDLGGLELESHQGAAFHVIRDDTKQKVYSGTIAKRKDVETDPADYYPECRTAHMMWFKNKKGSYTMADVWECDFTKFAGVADYDGDYRIVVEGMGCSYPFKMNTNVYLEPYKACMLGIYQQRCGIALDSKYSDWTHPECHKGTHHQSSKQGVDKDAGDPTGETYTHIWGGYHDAADSDKFPSHLTVTENLCWAFELRPEIFTDGELAIPENDNGVPDILDEAAWCIAFFMRMQYDHGGVRGSEWPDGAKMWVGPADAGTSLRYSAAANHLAYCMKLGNIDEITGPYYQDVDLTRANVLASAKKAYDWGMANYTPPADGRVGLAYTAHAWMFKATGESMYQDAYKKDNPITSSTTSLFPEVCDVSDNPYSQAGDWHMQDALMAYVTTNDNVDQAYQDKHKEAFLNWTTYDRAEASAVRGFRQGFHRRMPPLTGNHTSPEVSLQAVAFGITGDKQWLDILYPTVDYCLGGNEMNMTFISKMGHRYPKEIMHKSTIKEPYYSKGCAKGVIPYGCWAGPFGGSQVNDVTAYSFASGVTCYPNHRYWGQFELFFENRYLALGNEFTIHQTNGTAALAYAFVKDGGPSATTDIEGRRSTTVSTAAARPLSVVQTPGELKWHFGKRGKRTVTLTDLRGATLTTTNVRGAVTAVNTSDYAPGTYLWRVRSGGRTVKGAVALVR